MSNGSVSTSVVSSATDRDAVAARASRPSLFTIPAASLAGASTMTKAEVLASVEQIRKESQKHAEHVLQIVLPGKIIRLNDLFEKLNDENEVLKFQVEKYHKSRRASCNQEIGNLLVLMKAEILDLVDIVSSLRLWISLNIPKIEDGNNFGVGVQEEILVMLNSGRVSGLAVLEVITNYYFKRGKLISLSQKHPEVEDYRRSVLEFDEKQYISLIQSCMDLRNNYTLLYDKVKKNLDKLKSPRTSYHSYGW